MHFYEWRFQEKIGVKAFMLEWEEMIISEVQGRPFKFWFGFKTKDKLCSEIRSWPVGHWLNLLSSKLGLSMVVICFYFPPPIYLLTCVNAVCVYAWSRVRGRRGFLSCSHLQIPFWTLRICSRNSRLSHSSGFFLALFLWLTSWKEEEK